MTTYKDIESKYKQTDFFGNLQGADRARCILLNAFSVAVEVVRMRYKFSITDETTFLFVDHAFRLIALVEEFERIDGATLFSGCKKREAKFGKYAGFSNSTHGLALMFCRSVIDAIEFARFLAFLPFTGPDYSEFSIEEMQPWLQNLDMGTIKSNAIPSRHDWEKAEFASDSELFKGQLKNDLEQTEPIDDWPLNTTKGWAIEFDVSEKTITNWANSGHPWIKKQTPGNGWYFVDVSHPFIATEGWKKSGKKK